MYRQATRLRSARRAVVSLAASAVVAAGAVAVTAVPSAAAPSAANTVVVHADQPFRPVTHVATGSLYGLADSNTPSDDLAAAIKPNTFVQMPAGGHQQPTGDILQVAAKAQRTGAKVVDRLSDIYPGWPYQFSWSTWDSLVTNQINQVKASGITNLAAYAPWNESDNTWLASNGTFEDFWTHTYRLIRSLDPTTPIQGPSFSDNIGDMRNFLQNAVATNTVPDIMAWHELIRSSKIAGDVATVAGIMQDLGISPRPIAIEEYAAPAEVGVPGSLVGYIAKFERYGIHDAELAFWNQSGALGDLLTGRGGSPNGAYWLYKWYADMSGQMVTTTPPSATGLLDAAAAVTDDSKELDVVTGGGSGSTAVTLDGLNALQLGDDVNVKLEFTPAYGRTVAVPGPVTISNTTYHLGADGSITVPVVMNPAYAYHLVVTQAAAPTDLAGAYTITNVNSGLALDTIGSGTSQGTLVDQAAPVVGSATQTWKLVNAGSGLYKIVNAASGLVLGVQGASTANGAPVLVWGDSGTDDHLWQLIPDGNGHFRFANYGTGLVLAVAGMKKTDGSQVVQWTDGSVTSGCTPAGARQPGKIGSALSFCNTAAYVALPTSSVSSLTGDYTISTWVNPASNATWSRVFDIGASSSASMFLTLNSGSGLRFAITTSGAGGEQRINATSTLPLNQWSLLTVTVSGTTGTLYVNGAVVGTNNNMTIHPSAFGASTRNYIGKSQYSGDPALNATVDDFNVYNRALGASEVASLATGQAGAGNVVHYAFDETGGASVIDSSGNGRNGSIVNGASTTTTTTATDAATADHFWTLTRVTPTPPVVAVSTSAAADPTTGWYNIASSGTTGVPITVTASDPTRVLSLRCSDGDSTIFDSGALDAGQTASGLGSVSATGTFSLLDGAHSISCSATNGLDAVGAAAGSTTMPVTYEVDQTAPTLSVSVSPNPVLLNGNAAVDADAADDTSGLAGSPVCGGTDTSVAGTHSVTCSVSDNAGNGRSASASYVVGYDPGYFIQPINDPISSGNPGSVFKAGSTVPVKFQLHDATGALIPDNLASSIAGACQATISVVSAPGTADAVDESVDSSPASSGACFRYDSTTHQFLFNLGTKNYLLGNHSITVTVDASDGTVVATHTVIVGLR